LASVKPFQPYRYAPQAGDPATLLTQPYDKISPQMQARYLAANPYNLVRVILGETRDSDTVADNVYTRGARYFEDWIRQGILAPDLTPGFYPYFQDFEVPDSGERLNRKGFIGLGKLEDYGAGVVFPHEETLIGPKKDRLEVLRHTRAHFGQLFMLYPDRAGSVDRELDAATQGPPLVDVIDEYGARHRLWAATDAARVAHIQELMAPMKLLIADGHHRYETMEAYAEEVGGEGEHRYILMCLVALEDPGLTVFPTHRLVRGLDGDRQEALAETLRRDFEIEEISLEELAPPPQGDEPTPLQMGYIDAHLERPFRLTLKDQAIADAALAGHSEPYRHLDTGVLETLILKNTLGLSDDDISHFNGMFYARDTDEAVSMVRSGGYDAAFVMRPTPVRQVRELAAEGENMPPKSTFFYPKLLTGLLFNPLT
jgi:uncharacterized protein (DUF1015 family)